MNTRLKQFLSAENISQSQFADTINVVRASVSHVLSGRNNPSYDFIKAIMLSYPHLNMEWLLAGKGKMYKETVTAPALSPAQEPLRSVTDSLFPEIEIEDPTQASTLQESKISPPLSDLDTSVQISNDIITSKDGAQVPVKQRKVSKIIVMFDDGTFQEM